ncbi:hypothetical protein Taro_023185 [Colocasia esculenta]|uniref:Protein kinase domain-containing protein n=1 Tax=Colocasia esculenta TaxID=4460 RepID=A0A843VDR1_COLES|nr:hypothetical protein [Colocasia esculenta]
MVTLVKEINVLSQLKHPNIVQYYGSEIIDDCFYIYLEYIFPGSINKYVREHCGAITESIVRNFTRHILKGLAYLHSKKTMHRDIKGANLLVDSSGVVKLADFGMAKHLSGAKAVLSLKGTPYWMAPEVVQAMMCKDAGYDLSVDIWSLGCTTIEMFTGKHPWDGYEGIEDVTLGSLADAAVGKDRHARLTVWPSSAVAPSSLVASEVGSGMGALTDWRRQLGHPPAS